MDREPIWSVAERAWFTFLSMAMFIIGLVVRYNGPHQFAWNFETLTDLTAIGFFAVTMAFFALEGWDILGFATGVIQVLREKQRDKGRKEQDEKFRKWFESEKEKGTVFNSTPPLLNNGQDDESY